MARAQLQMIFGSGDPAPVYATSVNRAAIELTLRGVGPDFIVRTDGNMDSRPAYSGYNHIRIQWVMRRRDRITRNRGVVESEWDILRTEIARLVAGRRSMHATGELLGPPSVGRVSRPLAEYRIPEEAATERIIHLEFPRELPTLYAATIDQAAQLIYDRGYTRMAFDAAGGQIRWVYPNGSLTANLTQDELSELDSAIHTWISNQMEYITINVGAHQVRYVPSALSVADVLLELGVTRWVRGGHWNDDTLGNVRVRWSTMLSSNARRLSSTDDDVIEVDLAYLVRTGYRRGRAQSGNIMPAETPTETSRRSRRPANTERVYYGATYDAVHALNTADILYILWFPDSEDHREHCYGTLAEAGQALVQRGYSSVYARGRIVDQGPSGFRIRVRVDGVERVLMAEERHSLRRMVAAGVVSPATPSLPPSLTAASADNGYSHSGLWGDMVAFFARQSSNFFMIGNELTFVDSGNLSGSPRTSILYLSYRESRVPHAERPMTFVEMERFQFDLVTAVFPVPDQASFHFESTSFHFEATFAPTRRFASYNAVALYLRLNAATEVEISSRQEMMVRMRGFHTPIRTLLRVHPAVGQARDSRITERASVAEEVLELAAAMESARRQEVTTDEPVRMIDMSNQYQKQCFEYVDLPSHNKFWTVELAGSTVFVTYGKIGSIGSTQPKAFVSPSSARQYIDKKIQEKRRGGYVAVGHAMRPGADVTLLAAAAGHSHSVSPSLQQRQAQLSPSAPVDPVDGDRFIDL